MGDELGLTAVRARTERVAVQPDRVGIAAEIAILAAAVSVGALLSAPLWIAVGWWMA